MRIVLSGACILLLSYNASYTSTQDYLKTHFDLRYYVVCLKMPGVLINSKHIPSNFLYSLADLDTGVKVLVEKVKIFCTNTGVHKFL